MFRGLYMRVGAAARSARRGRVARGAGGDAGARVRTDPLRADAGSPFTFFRGGAYLMASDLAGQPRTGLHVQLCGDAQLSNFGGFAASDRSLVFDVNDFDETLPGPFEWDVKRLVASFAVAGRDRGFDAKQRRSINVAVSRSNRDAAAQARAEGTRIAVSTGATRRATQRNVLALSPRRGTGSHRAARGAHASRLAYLNCFRNLRMSFMSSCRWSGSVGDSSKPNCRYQDLAASCLAWTRRTRAPIASAASTQRRRTSGEASGRVPAPSVALVDGESGEQDRRHRRACGWPLSARASHPRVDLRGCRA